LEIRAAIDDLYARYLWGLDMQDIDLYVGTYWDDAVMKQTQLDGTIEVFRGAAVIREFTALHFGGYGGNQHRESTRRYVPDPAGEHRWSLYSYWTTSHRDEAMDAVSFDSTGLSNDIVERRGDEWRFAQRGFARWPADPAAMLRALDEA
jgi:hypothetical protein